MNMFFPVPHSPFLFPSSLTSNYVYYMPNQLFQRLYMFSGWFCNIFGEFQIQKYVCYPQIYIINCLVFI